VIILSKKSARTLRPKKVDRRTTAEDKYKKPVFVRLLELLPNLETHVTPEYWLFDAACYSVVSD